MKEKLKLNRQAAHYRRDFLDWFFERIPTEKISFKYTNPESVEASFISFKKSDHGLQEVGYEKFLKKCEECEEYFNSIVERYEDAVAVKDLLNDFGARAKYRGLTKYLEKRLGPEKFKSLSAARKKNFTEKYEDQPKSEIKTAETLHPIFTKKW